MQLGWMRGSGTQAPELSLTQARDTVAQADDLGLRQVHLSGFQIERLNDLPRPKHTRIGLDVADITPQSPRALIETVRRALDLVEGRLVLAIGSGKTARCRAISQTFETLLSDTGAHTTATDFPMLPPRPEVIALTKHLAVPDVARAAALGFHAVSPAWQTQTDISRHWPAIVAETTHAARRARPSHWHVARCIFISEDRAEIDAYRNNVAKNYMGSGASDPRVIAGPASYVAENLFNLRTRIGPFGTLQCIDPGLDPSMARTQRDRIATHLHPLLVAPTIAKPTPQELERT